MYVIKVRFDRNAANLQKKVQKMVDDMMTVCRPLTYSPEAGWVPEADLYETDEDIVLVLNVAGIQKEDLEVSFHGNFLSVNGKRSFQGMPRGTAVRYHHLEFSYGDFERVFRLPVAIDEAHVEAACSDGLLTVKIKKTKRPEGIHVSIRG